MAATVPNSLKSADITRFATRAAQVEKTKPAVAYWCNYWIVQQIVTKGLHNRDDESRAYTGNLMDKLEAIKSTNDDAINDEVAGQALIEQFGLEVFNRADNAVRANKATRQTADTFQAAYTFLELLHIWPPVDPEITAKIKFAKYHALRIAKAIKAGEDPNLSNPEPESTQSPDAPPLDPNDPDVRALQGQTGTPTPGKTSRIQQPSVQEVPDEHNRLESSLARISTLDQSLHPSRDSSIPRPTQHYPPTTPPLPTSNFLNHLHSTAANGEVSPLGPPSTAAPPSLGGGYFPRMPDDPHAEPHSDASLLPSAPSDIPPASPPDYGPTSPPATQPSHVPPSAPYDFPSHQQHPPPQTPHYPPHVPQQQPGQPNYETSYAAPRPSRPAVSGPGPGQAPYAAGGRAYYDQAPPSSVPPRQEQQQQQQQSVVLDEEAIAKAQKHARWAISALHFEDVTTAISELRGALETLGAR